jgi:Domain of unknown function (DUF4442)
MQWTPRRLKLVLNLYAPYLGAGIRVKQISPDWHQLQISMKLRWYNRNAVGTHFGGSFYSMVDPHLMLLLLRLLGKRYTIWDQTADIVFKKPGKGTVSATITITDAELEQIRSRTAGGQVYHPSFDIFVTDAEGDTVARINKVLYVRENPT